MTNDEIVRIAIQFQITGRTVEFARALLSLADAPKWIPIGEQLPERLEKPYHVAALCKEKYAIGPYAGEPTRGVYQDWVIRMWPANFTYWQPLPEPPKG